MSNKPRPLRADETALKSLSPPGRDFVTKATDPFHDYEIRPAQIPDGSVPASFMKDYRRSINVTCPFTLLAGDTWSVSIAVVPNLYASQLVAYDAGFINPSVIGSGGGPLVLIYTHNRGNAVVATSYAAIDLADNTTLADDTLSSRVTSLGFELTDATPPLYAGGMISVWRTNAASQIDTFAGGSGEIPMVFTDIGQIPADYFQSMTMVKSLTWEAKHGAYVTAPISRDASHYPWNRLSQTPSALQLKVGSTDRVICAAVSTTTPVTGLNRRVIQPARDSNIVPCGAVISGQNENAVFNLALRCIVEFAPGFAPQYQSVAAATPVADAAALQLVALALNHLPADRKSVV